MYTYKNSAIFFFIVVIIFSVLYFAIPNVTIKNYLLSLSSGAFLMILNSLFYYFNERKIVIIRLSDYCSAVYMSVLSKQVMFTQIINAGKSTVLQKNAYASLKPIFEFMSSNYKSNLNILFPIKCFFTKSTKKYSSYLDELEKIQYIAKRLFSETEYTENGIEPKPYILSSFTKNDTCENQIKDNLEQLLSMIKKITLEIEKDFKIIQPKMIKNM